MSTLHLVGGEKGGVGKSVVARVLAQYFVDEQVAFAAIDADTSHGALVRYYADYTQSVDLDSVSSADQIMDRVLAADRRVVVDLPAQSGRKLREWIESGDVVTFAKEMDVKLVFWHVTDGGYDSVQQLQRLLDDFSDAFSYVVVENQGCSSEFGQLRNSITATALFERAGRIIQFPKLDAAVMYEIDRTGSSFWAAANIADGERALSPMQRRRAKMWLSHCYAAFESVKDWL
jgi:hypothetical protein